MVALLIELQRPLHKTIVKLVIQFADPVDRQRHELVLAAAAATEALQHHRRTLDLTAPDAIGRHLTDPTALDGVRLEELHQQPQVGIFLLLGHLLADIVIDS